MGTNAHNWGECYYPYVGGGGLNLHVSHVFLGVQAAQAFVTDVFVKYSDRFGIDIKFCHVSKVQSLPQVSRISMGKEAPTLVIFAEKLGDFKPPWDFYKNPGKS